VTTNVESWNGTSWTEIAEINTARQSGGAAGQGTVTNALVFSGSSPAPISADTEFWNGTTWTEVNNTATARFDVGGSGVGSSSALVFGGRTPPRVATTEEWTAPDVVINTLTTS
jgi:hypothetical protein